MKVKKVFNIAILSAGLIVYVIVRADAWNLLVFSGTATGSIIQAGAIHSDPHTTASKVKVKYVFSPMNGKVYYGYGDRIFKKGENDGDPVWLKNKEIEIVYVIKNPEINDVNGRQYRVLFPLILVPFVLVMEMFISYRTRGD